MATSRSGRANIHYIAPGPTTLLAPLINELLGVDRAASPAVIELCSRDLDQLNELSRCNPQGSYTGIDRAAASLRPYLDPDTEDTDCPLTDYGVEAARFHPVRADVFAYVAQLRRERPHESALVYCQPPANGAMNKFADRATADRMLAPMAAASPDFRMLAAHTPTAPEWHYLYAALFACGPQGRVVVRVPERLLNLARMRPDRKLLISSRLVECVILLPKLPFHAGQAPHDSALIVLSHDNDRVSFLDGRHLGSTAAEAQSTDGRTVSTYPSGLIDHPFDTIAFDTLLDALQGARAGKPAADTPWKLWRTTEQLTDDSWSLMPFTYVSRAFDRENYEELGRHFTVQRGTPRKTLASLAEFAPSSDDERSYFPMTCHYLSLKPFVDGQTVTIENVAHLVGEPDTYDASACPPDAFKPLKTLSDDEPHVLIARAGTPFKAALLTPCEEPPFNPGDPYVVQPVWRDVRTAVLADSALGLTPKPDGACLPEFLLAFISTDEGQALLSTVAHGTSTPQLSSGDVRRMRIPVPDRAEQERFIERYRAKQAAYEEARAESLRLQALKRTLL